MSDESPSDQEEPTFAELQEMQERIGVKKFRQLTGQDKEEHEQKSKVHVAPRLDKHKPMEMSSKKRPSGPRHVVQEGKRVRRDPRFDELSGALNMDLFRKSYGFMDGKRASDVKALEKAMKTTKDPEEKERIIKALQSMKDRAAADQAEAERNRIRSEHRKTERELAAQGKKPFYLKKSDERRLELLHKYEERTRDGGLETALRSRRKHAASKVHRKLPERRQVSEE